MKKNVGIIFGGQSLEHEVSLKSAKNILAFIDKNKYDVVLLGIDKQGSWYIINNEYFLSHSKKIDLFSNTTFCKKILLFLNSNNNHVLIKNTFSYSLSQLDVIFPIVHGTIGEDGCLQGFLRMANRPFVGSSVLSSSINMDKDFSKRLLSQAGIKVAPWISIDHTQRDFINPKKIIDQFGLPLFIKPANQGSSLGVSKVKDIKHFDEAVDLAFSYDRKILIEKNIPGREIECAILGNVLPKASPCGEILLKTGFYSYKSKYFDEKNTKIIIPAKISDKISRDIRSIAIKAFTTLECLGMARIDFFLTENNKIILNEVNTLPGFTKISMYPKLWQYAGLNYQQLITQLIELAEESHRANKNHLALNQSNES